MDYDILVKELNSKKQNNSLTNKIYFALDSSILKTEDYVKLLELCSDNQVYLIKLDKNLKIDASGNLNIIDFSADLLNNSDYLMPDKIHLTEKGNKALSRRIIESKE